MIRKIIWLLIILGLAYSIYRWIDPMGAEELVTRIQSYFDKEKQDDVLVQDDSEPISIEEIPEVTIIPEETKAPIYTGTINTGSSVELDYVLSESPQTTGSQSTGTIVTTAQPTTTQPTTTKPKTTTTSSKKSLSTQDEADMKAFLNAIVE